MIDLVITSIGTASAAGVGFEHLCENLPCEPKISSVKDFEFHRFNAEIPCFRATSLDPEAVLGKKGLRTKDWATKLLLCGMEPLFKDQWTNLPPEEKPGICVGTAFGSIQSIGDFLSDSIVNGVNNVNPMAFANTVINSPTGNANIRFEVRSLSSTIATGFNAGLDAIIYACDFIRSGYLPVIMAGGLEEISYYGLLGLQRSGALSRGGRIRPFSPGADGMVMGEGVAMFCIETEASAKSRSGRIIAEIAGYASEFDPDESGPSSSSMRHAMQSACDMAGIAPAAIDFIAASANGTRNDAQEADAIAELFGIRPVAAYKSRIGECYGASGALALACAIADLKMGRVCGLPSKGDAIAGPHIVEGVMSLPSAEYALVNSFACDGNCAALVIKNR
jgi:3-oxoacyl-(acyl-carrier-protein) synthase